MSSNPPKVNDKWIVGLTPDISASDAGQLVLEARSEAVCRFLPLAAFHSDEDLEYVHQLRVSSRRARAAVELFRSQLPKRQRVWLRKWLKRLLKTAGRARDYDVLGLNYQHNGWLGNTKRLLKRIRRRRREAQAPITQLCTDLANGKRLRKKVKQAVRYMAQRADRCPLLYVDWARQQLPKITENFFDADPRGTDDLQALHRFRIKGKQLRYAVELVAPAFPSELRDELYPLIKQVQERLGNINDRVVAITQIKDWQDQGYLKLKRSELRHVIETESKQLADVISEYNRFWTPARSRAVRLRLLQLWEA